MKKILSPRCRANPLLEGLCFQKNKQEVKEVVPLCKKSWKNARDIPIYLEKNVMDIKYVFVRQIVFLLSFNIVIKVFV